MKRSKPNQRFYLLPYRILAKRWRTASFLFIPAGVGLWWLLSDIPEFASRAPAAFVISAIGLILTLYTLRASRAHVQCYTRHFVVRTPLLPLTVSYARVERVRPVEFKTIYDPQEEKEALRRLYFNLWGKTVIVVNLTAYPLPLWWLRLWVHPYMLHPKEKALIFPVDDWMALSRQLDTRWMEWRERRRRRVS